MTVLEKKSVRNMLLSISVEQYHRINELGLIDTNTELIEGFIVEKMTKSPLHSYILSLLLKHLQNEIPSGYWVRQEHPITLAVSEPEPDISIVKGSEKDFKDAHPQYAELVVEIAVSSLDLDREKISSYARADIPEYWIVIAKAQQVEVYREPEHDRYKQMYIYSIDDSIKTIHDIQLDLRSIFE